MNSVIFSILIGMGQLLTCLVFNLHGAAIWLSMVCWILAAMVFARLSA